MVQEIVDLHYNSYTFMRKCNFVLNLLGWISDWFLTEDEGQVYIIDDSNFEYVICVNHSEH